MKWPRRVLLELSALLVVSSVVGFLGPFGTYMRGDLASRAVSWAMLLFGAYILARPTMELWSWIARITRLPQAPLIFWGMILFSVPIAIIWKMSGAPEANLIGGYASIFSFTVLCSLLVMVVAWWAERADASLFRYYSGALPAEAAIGSDIGRPALGDSDPDDTTDSASSPADARQPRLRARLSASFKGEILALKSEDHYVRVHGLRGSELLLVRLRDAIAEMDGLPGEQTHRSWWVARGAVAGVHVHGRGCEIRLTNGERALVARDSVDRLRRSHFLPG
jgi:hypothetical protein